MKNGFCLIQDLIVPVTQHPVATAPKAASSPDVLGLCIEMLPAIQFEDEVLFDACKIRNECSQRNLATKFEAAEIAVAQMAPK